MKDQMALYRLESTRFEAAKEMDFIGGDEVAAYLERKGHYIGDLLVSQGAIGDLIAGLAAIFGDLFLALLGKKGPVLGPPGPYVFCTHLESDTLHWILKSLAQARSVLGRHDDSNPTVAQRAQRLAQLGKQLQIEAHLRQLLQQLGQFLESGRQGAGALLVVYTRW